MQLYTKNGDTGLTSTKNRHRISKSNQVFALLGTLDELTSALAFAKHTVTNDIVPIIEKIQTDVLLLIEDLSGGEKFASPSQTASLENAIDALIQNLPDESNSGLPGKTKSGASLHTARAISRRAEREAVKLAQTGGISRDVLAWLNRVSDLIYALAQMADSIDNGSSKVAVSNELCDFEGDMFINIAQKICKKAILKARETGVKAVAAVSDSGGNLVCLNRDDDAFIASIDIAINKAFTSVALKMSTEQVGKLASPGAELYGLQFTNQGKIVMFGGGAPLIQNQKIIGGFGISGGTAEQDTFLCNYIIDIFERGEFD